MHDLRMALVALGWIVASPGALADPLAEHVLIAPGLGSQSVDQSRPEIIFQTNSLVNDNGREAKPANKANFVQDFMPRDGGNSSVKMLEVDNVTQ